MSNGPNTSVTSSHITKQDFTLPPNTTVSARKTAQTGPNSALPSQLLPPLPPPTTTTTTTTTTAATATTTTTHQGREALVRAEGADACQQRQSVVQGHNPGWCERLVDERGDSPPPGQCQAEVPNLPSEKSTGKQQRRSHSLACGHFIMKSRRKQGWAGTNLNDRKT